MPYYRDEAVVLRTHKLGEADRIVTLLTRYHGQVRVAAKGVRRTTSKFGSRLEPFMVIDVQLYEGRSLDTVSQAETIDAYGGSIMQDYAAYTAASAMVETAERLTGEDSTPQQYLLLVGGLRSLARAEHPSSLILDSYLLRAMAVAGWAPSFGECAVCASTGSHTRFIIQLGGMVCDDCQRPGAAVVDTETLGLLGALLSGDWQVAEASTAKARDAASGLVAAYSQWHIERGLKSLQHVERQ